MPTSDFDPVSLQPGAEVAGWRVLRSWRRDGFSITWVVERGGERRLLRMALRRPVSPGGPDMERFLEREVGALRRVQHPGLLRLHEEGRWPEPLHGFRYLLLEHVEGMDLLEARRCGMTALQVVHVLSRLASALDALHREGVSHGGIRSENVILREGDGQPVLVDLSLADWPGNPFPPGAAPSAGLKLSGLSVPVISGKRFAH